MITTTISAVETGRQIDRLMRERGLSVNDVADMAGVSHQAVYRWLNGKRIPSLDNLILLSEVLAIPLDDIIVRQ